ncbi:hypothetical protein AcW2_001316 [Taiwanofungus camphoratus]|nr:hypothetical protein AcW2_001316 [Antrodia cinnamomea]
MQFRTSAFLQLLSVLSLFTGHGAGTPTKRQIIISAHGIIDAPSANTTIAPGATFAFEYSVANACESGYSPLTVWLLQQPPSDDDLTSDGVFAEGTYLYEFGKYLVPNFGLPAMSDPPPPPSNLSMPDFSSPEEGSLVFSNATFYFTVVETYRDCPPDIPLEYGMTSNPIVYNATSGS